MPLGDVGFGVIVLALFTWMETVPPTLINVTPAALKP